MQHALQEAEALRARHEELCRSTGELRARSLQLVESFREACELTSAGWIPYDAAPEIESPDGPRARAGAAQGRPRALEKAPSSSVGSSQAWPSREDPSSPALASPARESPTRRSARNGDDARSHDSPLDYLSESVCAVSKEAPSADPEQPEVQQRLIRNSSRKATCASSRSLVIEDGISDPSFLAIHDVVLDAVGEEASAKVHEAFKRCCFLNLPIEPHRSGRLYAITSSSFFRSFCTAVIVFNGVTVSIAFDYEIRNIAQEALAWQSSIELFFTIFYSSELVLKLLVHRGYFFINDEARWNNFDLVLVVLGLWDTFADLLALDSDTNLTFARLGRLLKLSKILRVFRALRFLGSLRQMLGSIVQSMAMLFWAMVLLLLLWWTLSLVMIQGMSSVLRSGEITDETAQAIVLRFGSIPRAIFTLFSVSTGGQDWEETYTLVAMAGDFYVFVLLGYVSFFSISLYNILTGIVVEHVVTNASLDDNDRLMLYRHSKIKLGHELKRLFATIDKDGSGEITKAEFHTAMERHEVHSMFEDNGLDPKDAAMFFEILSTECHGIDDDDDDVRINMVHFIDGFVQMRGPAAGIDVQVIRCQADQVLRSILQQQAQLNQVLVTMAGSGSPAKSSHVAADHAVPERGRADTWAQADYAAWSHEQRWAQRLDVEELKRYVATSIDGLKDAMLEAMPAPPRRPSGCFVQLTASEEWRQQELKASL